MALELRIEMRAEASALISEKFWGWVSLIGKMFPDPMGIFLELGF